MHTCSSCGRESPEDFAFCPACAAPFDATTKSREVRKTVTVVFCDVTGSTALGERLDPESLRGVMSRYFAEMRAALERHGGTVEKFIGDAVMAVFGIPLVHEDDALRAVRAAEEMREAIGLLRKELERDHGVMLAARIGVNTGEVVAGEATGETLVTGDTVNVAARLEQAATPGEVLIGADTHRLVRDAVVVEQVEPLELKGKLRPVPAFRLIEVTAGKAGVARKLDSPMVGRERQLAQLHQAFDAAATDRACQLFTVLGAPGVGKSRLVEEFLNTVSSHATILRGRCLPYGDGITFFPVGEVVREAAGLEAFDDPGVIERKICAILGDGEQPQACSKLAQLLGVGDEEGATEETLWAIRHFLESVAQGGRLAVVFDDVHWGQPTFLDLIEHIADWSRDAPILVLCMARPDLLDERPAWGGGKLNATTISLEPLSDDECDALIENLLGHAGLPDEARRRILRAADGTPLFVEEMLSMLIDDGLLVRDGGAWVTTGDITSAPVPPTVQALLAARLDRLAEAERDAIERASVAGKQFHVGALAAMADDGNGLDVRPAVMGLVRRGLVGPDRSLLASDEAFRFRHLLMRDTAYDSIPKALRSTLHERFADWLIGVAGDRIEEQEEIAGYHLEQGSRLRAELAPADDHGLVLALRAAAHLMASGDRARDRGDPAAASTLFHRTADLLPVGHGDRPRALYEAGRSDASLGDVRRTFSTLDAAATSAAAAGQIALEWRARVQRAAVTMLLDPHARSTEDIRAELTEAIQVFESVDDDAGLAATWTELAGIEWMPCRYDLAERAADRAVRHARAANDKRLLAQAHLIGCAAQLFGSMRPPEAIDSVTAARDEVGPDSVFDGVAMANLAVNLAMMGRFDQARDLLDRALTQAERLGIGFVVAVTHGFRGEVELLADDLEAAERWLATEYRMLDELGDEGHKATSAGELALLLCELARSDDAEPYVRVAREVAADDDLASLAGAGTRRRGAHALCARSPRSRDRARA
jgi:class 3 adenylate cyclase/tetratricopeptide (TPR) repeat protein